MSLGGGKSQSTTDTRLNGISVNQSVYGSCVPLNYGQNRIPATLGWYGNFIATPHTSNTGSGGKGGGGGSSNTTFTYSASWLGLLCEGQSNSVAQVWQDKAITTLSALGMTFFSGAGAQAAWSYLTTNFPTQADGYDHTAYVAVANFDLGSSAALPNLAFETTGLLPYNFGTINDAEASAMIVDYCTDANHGANFPYLNTAAIQAAGTGSYQAYCIAMGFFLSPLEDSQRSASDFITEQMMVTNSNAVWSAGLLNFIPYADTSVTGNSRTFTPNLTPVYSFSDDDYLPNTDGQAVVSTRKPLTQTYNVVRVEYLNRANAYNVDVAEASDANDIRVNGMRVMPTITLHSIKTLALARQVAQLILQRQLYIRRQYVWSVRADYCLLEPMDPVAITDNTTGGLGINNKLVRLIEVDDDENDILTFTAEEMLVGTASAPLYNWEAAQGYAANYLTAPPAVATPLIFTAPPLLVTAAGGYELWIAVDQGAAGSWGGCDVYMSLDATSYIYAGTVNGAARYGTLTASLANHADPDTVDTLAVVLTNPSITALQLVSGSAADYNNLRTLIYVDGEIMAYQTAALTSAGHYNLTNLRRAQYGSSSGLHASASSFARIDAGIFRVPFDPGMIGQTMHFKLCSFNIFGQATQLLSGVTDYTHVLSATNAGQLMPSPVTLVGRGVTVAGDKVFKSGGVDATWDSDVYSLQGYTNGAFVSWRPVQVNFGFMVALNSDPTLDSSFASLDYALYCMEAGAVLRIYESGVNVGAFGTYAAGDDLSISYDGAFVRYLQNGAVLRQVPAQPNLTLYLDSSFWNSQAAATNLKFGPYGTATPVLFIPRGNCTVSDTNISKEGGSSAWDSDVYSINSYPTCHVVWKANDVVGQFMISLNQDPTTDSNFTSLDYAMLCNAGALSIWESGTNVLTVGAYSAGDYLAITYDGAHVIYWKNATALRSVAIAGKTFFMDSSFFKPASGCNSLEFGPTSAIPLMDTGGISINAATVVAETLVAGPIIVSAVATYTNIVSQSIGAYPYDVQISFTYVVTAGRRNSTPANRLNLLVEIAYGATTADFSIDTMELFPASNTVQGTLTVPAGNAITVTAKGVTNAAGPDWEHQDSVLHVETVKR